MSIKAISGIKRKILKTVNISFKILLKIDPDDNRLSLSVCGFSRVAMASFQTNSPGQVEADSL
jgi:hypothetical protein